MKQEKATFYIASKWENRQAVQDLQVLLEKEGLENAWDWTRHDEMTSLEEWKEQAAAHAYDDADGVASADIFILLTPTDPEMQKSMVGALVELGIALANWEEKMIFIVGDQPYNLFRYHPGIELVNSLPELLEVLRYEA